MFDDTVQHQEEETPARPASEPRTLRNRNGRNSSSKGNQELQHAQVRPQKPPAEYDPIFFRKVDIKVGVNLLYKGRLQPNTSWTVTAIKSDRGIGKGMKSVQEVRKLTDLITVQSETGEVRRMSFSYASYSAIWQLPRN
jgi:hypothetical protein